MDARKNWSPEMVETLIGLVKQGFSGGMIANRLGVTRSSAIGKAARLGLHVGVCRNGMSREFAQSLRRPSSTPFNARRERKNNPRCDFNALLNAKAKAAPLPISSEPEIARKALLDLEPNDCRFIPVDARSSGPIFCALPVVPGTSWCAAHLARVSEPVAVQTRQPSSPTVATPKTTVAA